MVEWKELGDICEILDSQRKPISKGNRNQGEYPYYGANGVQDYVDDYIFDGTFLLLGEDGSVINKDNSPVLHWATGKIWVNNHAHILKENDKALLRYLYYSLQCTDVSDIVRGVPPKINQANMRNILIPIPSLSEQTRIVGILDTFTAAIDNLKQQITERRKQYEHYRDELLDLEGKEGVEMKTLPELSKNCDRERKPITSSKRVTGNFPYYGASGIVDFVDGYIFDGDYLLISEDGANLIARTTPIAFSIKGKNWVNNHAHVLKFKEIVTQKFVEIYLNMISLEPWINGAAQPKLNQDNLNRIEIPVPSLSEQSRIVSILDTFEASIANLEAQLKEREKQYEYYRNKLLTFE